jgi:hypothetical protein
MNDLQNLNRKLILKKIEQVKIDHNLNYIEEEMINLILHFQNEFDEDLLFSFLNLYKKFTFPMQFRVDAMQRINDEAGIFWQGKECCG